MILAIKNCLSTLSCSNPPHHPQLRCVFDACDTTGSGLISLRQLANISRSHVNGATQVLANSKLYFAEESQLLICFYAFTGGTDLGYIRCWGRQGWEWPTQFQSISLKGLQKWFFMSSKNWIFLNVLAGACFPHLWWGWGEGGPLWQQQHEGKKEKCQQQQQQCSKLQQQQLWAEKEKLEQQQQFKHHWKQHDGGEEVKLQQHQRPFTPLNYTLATSCSPGIACFYPSKFMNLCNIFIGSFQWKPAAKFW